MTMNLYIYIQYIKVGMLPLSIAVTTRTISFLVGDPRKPSFAIVTGSGGRVQHLYIDI